MENKIGEIVTLPDGRKAEVVEGHKCTDCIFQELVCDDMTCDVAHRSDHKDIIYKEIKEE